MTVAAIELQNKQLSCVIVPEFGAAVTRLDISRKGTVYPVLMPTAPEALVPGGDPRLFSLAHIAPFGGPIRNNRFKWEGNFKELLPNLPGCPLFTNGIAWQQPWVGKKDGRYAATCTYRHKHKPGWPFDFSLTVVFDLDEDNLVVAYELANEGKQGTMPYGLGSTFRLPRSRKALLCAGVSSLWHEDAAHVPVRMGEVPFDLDLKEGVALDTTATRERWFSGWVGKATVDYIEHRMSLMVRAETPLTHLGFACASGAEDFRLSMLTHVPGALDIVGHDEDETGYAVLGPGESVTTKFRIDADMSLY